MYIIIFSQQSMYNSKKEEDDDKWNESQKIALKKILDRRKKGYRTFKSKEEEYEVMIQESIDFLTNIFESNTNTIKQELNYNFKYTEKDIQDIKDYFENANNEWMLVDHSPIFKKHMELFDYAISTRKLPVQQYKYKKQF